MRNAFHRVRIASEAHTPQLLMLSHMQDRRAAMSVRIQPPGIDKIVKPVKPE